MEIKNGTQQRSQNETHELMVCYSYVCIRMHPKTARERKHVILKVNKLFLLLLLLLLLNIAVYYKHDTLSKKINNLAQIIVHITSLYLQSLKIPWIHK